MQGAASALRQASGRISAVLQQAQLEAANRDRAPPGARCSSLPLDTIKAASAISWLASRRACWPVPDTRHACCAALAHPCHAFKRGVTAGPWPCSMPCSSACQSGGVHTCPVLLADRMLSPNSLQVWMGSMPAHAASTARLHRLPGLRASTGPMLRILTRGQRAGHGDACDSQLPGEGPSGSLLMAACRCQVTSSLPRSCLAQQLAL